MRSLTTLARDSSRSSTVLQRSVRSPGLGPRDSGVVVGDRSGTTEVNKDKLIQRVLGATTGQRICPRETI